MKTTEASNRIPITPENDRKYLHAAQLATQHTLAADSIRDGWYVYVLSLEDGTLYVGSSNDPIRRFREHRQRVTATRKSKPIKIEYLRSYNSEYDARREETNLIHAICPSQSHSRKKKPEQDDPTLRVLDSCDIGSGISPITMLAVWNTLLSIERTTSNQLSKRTGVARGTPHAWKTRCRIVRFSTVAQIERALGYHIRFSGDGQFVIQKATDTKEAA